MLFTPELVLAQARYLGLMENVRVRRAGYAFRQLYGPFLNRYKMLSAQTWPRWAGSDRYGVERDMGVPAPEAAGSEPPCPPHGVGMGLSKCWRSCRSPPRSWRSATPRSSSARHEL